MRGLMLVAAIAVAGCDEGAEKRICSDAPTKITPGDVKACVHKWAYRLARSADPVSSVADAAVIACDGMLITRADDEANSPAVQAAGDPDKVKVETYNLWKNIGREEALFRVVQARAGNCELP